MSCTKSPDCTCGCCSGTSIETPLVEQNLPGLSAIAYRVGTWGAFRESMLARLSSADYPALQYLKTRDTDDFSIALLDASAVVFDILTFYQERLANESYLRTATQLRSLTELARLIGYQPAPGVAAETYLAFTLKAATGLPANPNTTAITIPAGTQVQSVAEQNLTPQTFETSADILAKADWNALPITAGIPRTPAGAPSGPGGLYLAGTTTQLNPGDSLLLLGADRENWTPNATPSEYWDIVTLNQIVVDNQNNLTWVGWDKSLQHGSGSGSSPASGWTTVKVFAFRQKVSLFGNNAPSANLFTLATNPTKPSLPHLINASTSNWQWKNFSIPSITNIDLDAPYAKVVSSSWFALLGVKGAQLFKVTSAKTISRSDFAISTRVTALAADYADPNISDVSYYPLPGTAVLAQSEQLTVARQPVDHPLYGNVIDIDVLRPDLVGVQAIAVFGKAQKLAVAPSSGALTFIPDDGPEDGSQNLVLHPGDTVTLISPGPLPINGDGSIPDWINAAGTPALRVADSSGRTGTITASIASFTLTSSAKTDPDIQEFALVSSVLAATTPYPHTQIFLQNPLAQVYDRHLSTVNANVGLATAGRSVSEIMGNGSAATPNQSFLLKQSPLTFTQAATPDGRLSTLQVTANGVKWKEVPTLYQQKPQASVFATLDQSDATTEVLFGDGSEGATLPTGQNNIQASYRIGSGVATNVRSGSVTTLVDRPLGVSGVINPSAATGGQDAQSITGVRANAPSSVLTLGRAVSITDYQNYAASFGGIAKAAALWLPSGPGRGVFLTVAGAGGVALPPGNPTLNNLIASLRAYGSLYTPIHAVSFLETLFSLSANVAYDPAYDATAVQAAIVAALRSQYSFANRSFGQGVSGDEIAALVQAVPGVVAVNVTNVIVGATSTAGDLAAGGWSVYAYHQWLADKVTLTRPCSGTQMRICPYVPTASPSALPMAAEILVLDPNPNAIALGVLS
jgi:hypothetical protein